MRASRADSSEDEEPSSDDEVKTSSKKIGLTRKKAGAKRLPNGWDRPLGYYRNGEGGLGTVPDDPYDPEDTPTEFVVLLKVDHPVALSWLDREFFRQTIYQFFPNDGEAKKPTFATTDAALKRKLGEAGMVAVANEISERRNDLPMRPVALDDETEKDPIFIAAMRKLQIFDLSSNYFYGKEEIRLKCLTPAMIPTDKERIDAFLMSHEGGKGAVAIPVSFWNHACHLKK